MLDHFQEESPGIDVINVSLHDFLGCRDIQIDFNLDIIIVNVGNNNILAITI